MYHTEIPPFATLAGVFADAADLVRPPERVSVSEAALRHRVLDNPGGGYSGPWSFDLAPYLRRPMDCLTDDSYRLVALMGCAQGGKTEIPLNWLLQMAIYDPADLIWCQVDRDMMRDFSVSRVDKMIRLIPELRAKQLQSQGADNIFSKQFRGMMARFIWPVAGQFTQRPAPRFVLDDFDNIAEDIDGQGDALTLIQGRQTTFEGREKGAVLSTPALGATRGIEALVRSGTDESLRVRCPHCDQRGALDFEKHLNFRRGDTPAAAEETAHVVCPSNGCVVEPPSKFALMQTGVWAEPDQSVTPDGDIEGPARDTDIASFSVNGLMGFASWPRLARLYREAEIAFEAGQDEGKLRAFFNVRVGVNYVSRTEGAEPVATDALAARRETWKLGTVPPGVKVLVATVDVQSNRFAVLVTGFGDGLQSWLIDRFDIAQLDDGRTNIRPDRYAEHWDALLSRVMLRRYPLSDAPEITMPILSTGIDTGGLAGVSANATKFWYTARRARVPDQGVTLIKGGNNPRAQILPAPTPLDRRADGRVRKRGPKLFVPNVHEIKNFVDVRLRRATPGPGYIHFAADFDAAYLDEITAERREKDRWVKIRPANETLDLMVYAEATRRRLSGARTDTRWVPSWARRPVSDAAIDAAPAPDDDPGPGDGAADPPPVETIAAPADHPHSRVVRRRRRARRSSRGGYVSGWKG